MGAGEFMVSRTEEERAEAARTSAIRGCEQRSNGMNRERSSASNDVLNVVIHMKIDPDDIIYLVAGMVLCHLNGIEADWFAQVKILLKRYPNDGLRVFCITERMRCLTAVAR